MVKIKVHTSNIFKGDRVIWSIFIFMCLASLLIVTSSTASMTYVKYGGDWTVNFMKHFSHLLLGFGAMVVFQSVSMDWWRKWSPTIFFMTICLLGFISISGAVINSASRWGFIPLINATFQPSYIAKVMLVMVLAIQISERQKYISEKPLLPSLNPQRRVTDKDKERNLKILIKTTLPILGPVAIVCVLIVFSNLSTALMIYACSVIMLYVGRIRLKEIGRLLAVTILAGSLLFGVMAVMGVGRVDTWSSRIKGFFGIDQTEMVVEGKSRPMTNLENQKFQAKVAVASGGVLGKGPGNSTQRSNLPLAYADFAYAFIVEEYGLVGAVVVLLAFLIIFYRCTIIARHSKSAFNGLTAFGLGLTILIQAMVNMAVSVSMMPVTGQSLPILSLGGTSLLFTGISFGIIQSVARQNDLDRIEAENANQ